MNLQLSWDLFVFVFFAVITAYSFIIGKNQTLKIIISTYIAILTADGISHFLMKFVSPKIFSTFFESANAATSLIALKIFLFIATIVLLSVRGGFQVDLNRGVTHIREVLVTASLGILNAGLVISTLLVYISGASFTQLSQPLSSSAITIIQSQSKLVTMMIDYHDIWFSLPALAFVLLSFTEQE